MQEEEEARFEGTGKYEVLPCSMVRLVRHRRSCDHVMYTLQVLRSIGYRVPPLEGVPYEPTMRTIPNRAGRVTWGEFQLTQAFSQMGTILVVLQALRKMPLSFQVSVLRTAALFGNRVQYCSGWPWTGSIAVVGWGQWLWLGH